MSDFDNILDRSGSEVSDEQVLYPNGTYMLRCAGVAFNSFTKDDGEEVQTVSFGFAVGAPQEDVDREEFIEASEKGVQGQRVWKRFSLDNSKNVADFKRAIRQIGIDPNSPEYETLRDAAKDCKNHEVLGYIGMKSYTNRAGVLVKDNEVKSLTSVASLQDAA